MGDQTIFEIHVQGLPEIAVKAADEFMNAVSARGYVVRMGDDMMGIPQGDGWIGVDYGDKERGAAEAEITYLIGDINGGDCLKIEESGRLDSN